MALLGEAPVATVPPPAPTAEGEEPAPVAASTTPSAGNLADPLIVRISQLSTLLFQARFRTFWSTLASPEYEDVRGFTTNVTGFEDAVRRSALGSVRGAFRTIGEARIASYLNLSGKCQAVDRLAESCDVATKLFTQAHTDLIAYLLLHIFLPGSELASFISQQPGWKLENGTVHVPSNPDNEIKATVIREDLQLDRKFAIVHLPLSCLFLAS